jgi:hypothetical protein
VIFGYSYLRVREKEISMHNPVFLKELARPAVIKMAGLLALAALGLTFFAMPMDLAAMAGCGTTQNAIFKAIITGFVPVPGTDNGEVKTVTLVSSAQVVTSKDWILVQYTSDQSYWAGSIKNIMGSGLNGTATGGSTDIDSTQLPSGLKISGIPVAPLKFDPVAFAKQNPTLITHLTLNNRNVVTPPKPQPCISSGWGKCS